MKNNNINNTFWDKQVMGLIVICVSALSVWLGIYFFFGFAITEAFFMLLDAMKKIRTDGLMRSELKSRLNKFNR
jgi:hypothetical protein